MEFVREHRDTFQVASKFPNGHKIARSAGALLTMTPCVVPVVIKALENLLRFCFCPRHALSQKGDLARVMSLVLANMEPFAEVVGRPPGEVFING